MGDQPCFVSHHNSSCLLPIGDALPVSDHGLVEIVWLSDGLEVADVQKLSALQPKDIKQMQTWFEEAHSQYLSMISPDGFADRCEDWLVEDLGISTQEACAIYEARGITPFLRLERVVFVPSSETTCFDFKCLADAYLWDHGFNVDRTPEATWNVSPRMLLCSDQIYPASSLHRPEPPTDRTRRR